MQPGPLPAVQRLAPANPAGAAVGPPSLSTGASLAPPKGDVSDSISPHSTNIVPLAPPCLFNCAPGSRFLSSFFLKNMILNDLLFDRGRTNAPCGAAVAHAILMLKGGVSARNLADTGGLKIHCAKIKLTEVLKLDTSLTLPGLPALLPHFFGGALKRFSEGYTLNVVLRLPTPQPVASCAWVVMFLGRLSFSLGCGQVCPNLFCFFPSVAMIGPRPWSPGHTDPLGTRALLGGGSVWIRAVLGLALSAMLRFGRSLPHCTLGAARALAQTWLTSSGPRGSHSLRGIGTRFWSWFSGWPDLVSARPSPFFDAEGLMMGPCPSDTAEACSAPPPFSLGGFFRASGERSGLCFLRERAHAMLMLAGRCWVSGSRREPTDRGSWGPCPHPIWGLAPTRFADLSPARLGGSCPQADLEVLPAWPRVVPRDQCGLSPAYVGCGFRTGWFSPLFATLLAADRVFTPFTRLTRARRPVDFARHWAGDPCWPSCCGSFLVASRRVCALIMGDVVYPGPPDYLCFLFDSQQAAPPLGVGSTGVDTGAGERPWGGGSASCCPVRTKMGLTAISVGLRRVNFHPFRGADYRWAGTVASFPIPVFDGGALRLVRRHGPWRRFARLVSGFACRLILRLSGARGRGLARRLCPMPRCLCQGLPFGMHGHLWPVVMGPELLSVTDASG
ncbi:hypothetical protein PAPYR_11167 [Paratrimastix pyriformis]|uniref:Uncharacterized protein n=1 Tax=Paratrimastix pyriformis TaxID=342808 RepID=A0ABQ8UA42_9EUKA|nr:hypothetical protein PAPYR_11167 [Paratrimastix pyriformis]